MSYPRIAVLMVGVMSTVAFADNIPVLPPQALTPSTQQALVGQPTNVKALMTPQDRTSYALGVLTGQRAKTQGGSLNLTYLLQGMQDGFAGTPLQMTQQEVDKAALDFQNQMKNREEAELNSMAGKNQQTGEMFLASNRNKLGVITLDDGLQYRLITMGKGQVPTEKDKVTVEYQGTFPDGKEFDSSYKHGQPLVATLQDMLPGWIEALKRIPAGSAIELYVPSNLAYGEKGAPPVIGPNQVLIFRINLLAVNQA